MQLIETRPHFSALHKIQSLCDEFPALIEGLINDGDTVQRASDLINAAKELLNLVKSVCLEEE